MVRKKRINCRTRGCTAYFYSRAALARHKKALHKGGRSTRRAPIRVAKRTSERSAKAIVKKFTKWAEANDFPVHEWPPPLLRFLRNCLWREGAPGWKDPFAFCERERLLTVLKRAAEGKAGDWGRVEHLTSKYRGKSGPSYEALAELLREIMPYHPRGPEN